MASSIDTVKLRDEVAALRVAPVQQRFVGASLARSRKRRDILALKL